MTHFSPQSQLDTQTTAMPSSEVEDLRPCTHDQPLPSLHCRNEPLPGQGQVPCWNKACACTEDTRKHYPLLGKASRKISQNFENKAVWIQVPFSGSLFSF